MNILGRVGCLCCCAYAGFGLASVDNLDTGNLILQQDLTATFETGGNSKKANNTPNVVSNHPVSADPLVDAVTMAGDLSPTALNNQANRHSHGQGLLQAQFDDIYFSVIDGSDDHQTFVANESFTSSHSNKNQFESTGSDSLTVFNIKSSDRLTGGISFGFTPSVPTIINVSGTELLDINAKAQENFDKLSVSPLVFWNFYDYTGLNFTGDGWNGSVLAPYAHLTSYAGSLDGGIAAVSNNGADEVHNKLLTFEPPQSLQTAISEPSVAVMLFGGLWLAICGRRKYANV